MNIMFEDSITDDIKNKYTLLELDTFYFASNNSEKTAYCLVENTPIMEISVMDKNLELHTGLMRNYKIRNWKYCEDALDHLIGCWNGEVDSFYKVIKTRIESFKENDPGDEWSHLINCNT